MSVTSAPPVARTDGSPIASDRSQGRPDPVDPEARDLAEARAYGARAASLPEWLDRSWEEVAPLLRAGWISRHAEICSRVHDWRLAFPAVRQGWKEAGGESLAPC